MKRVVVAASLVASGLILPALVTRLDGDDVAAPSRARAAAGPGTIEGTVFYRNDRKHAWRLARFYVKSPRSGELAEAVVALAGPSLKKFAPAHDSAVSNVDQKEMRFVPETVAIQAGDRVRFTNSDAQTHNISLNDPRLRFSDTIAKGQQAVEPFPSASGIRRPFALGCTFHSQMQGWIYVFDHPFFRVTHDDGQFRLEHVPPGNYRLEVAQSAGELYASQLIQVEANQTVKVDLILTPANRSTAD